MNKFKHVRMLGPEIMIHWISEQGKMEHYFQLVFNLQVIVLSNVLHVVTERMRSQSRNEFPLQGFKELPLKIGWLSDYNAS